MLLYQIITLDGPVGVGKSSVARRLAASLGYRHIDTGAMYRSVTLAATREKLELEDPAALAELAKRCDIRLDYEEGRLRVWLNGEDVSGEIRDPEVSRNTSFVADCQEVRRKLVSLQRRMGLEGPSVLEGRDISTVVFPDAFWKFYLDASLEERTRRRVSQLRGNGRDPDFEATRKAIATRDSRDRSRPYGPLKIAPDAIILDTTHLGEEDVIDTIMSFVKITSP